MNKPSDEELKRLQTVSDRARFELNLARLWTGAQVDFGNLGGVEVSDKGICVDGQYWNTEGVTTGGVEMFIEILQTAVAVEKGLKDDSNG